MTEKEFAQKVVLGFTVINQMEWEIELLVNLVFDYLQSEAGRAFIKEYRMDDKILFRHAVDWELSDIDHPGHLEVRSVPDGRRIYWRTDNGRSIEVAKRDVAQVYASLPFFLSDMVRRFPQLASSLQPYVHAADMR